MIRGGTRHAAGRFRPRHSDRSHRARRLDRRVRRGLSDGERAVLELTYQHGLEGTDLAAALEVSAARARAMALRLRQTVDRSLGALLVARRIQCDPAHAPNWPRSWTVGTGSSRA